MSGKKLPALILIALGVVAFGASYGLSLWLGAGPTQAGAETQVTSTGPDDKEPPVPQGAGEEGAQLEEKHLTALIREVRAKLTDCEEREARLREEEHRLRIAHQDLQDEAQQLETLRLGLADAITNLQQAKAELGQGRYTFEKEEEENLKNLAAVFASMDTTEAAKTLNEMCVNNQEADVVKILRFMPERNTAKVLAAMSDNTVRARLCGQMKRVHKEE